MFQGNLIFDFESKSLVCNSFGTVMWTVALIATTITRWVGG